MQGCHLLIAGAPICLARPSGTGYDLLDRDCDALRRGDELAEHGLIFPLYGALICLAGVMNCLAETTICLAA